LIGCANIPDGEISYFAARSTPSFKVVRSVICDAKDLPVVASTVTPTVTHSANTEQSHHLNLQTLRGTFVDSDIKFEFYEDGRLKSVNASQTGQGEAALKAAATLAGALATFTPDKQNRAFPEVCSFIKEHGAGKPISITYEGVIDPEKINEVQNIPADAASDFYARGIEPALNKVCAVVRSKGEPSPLPFNGATAKATLTVHQPGWANVEVMTTTPGGGCAATTPLWKGRLSIAQLGKDYLLPIPAAAPFGKQTFGATFLESGAITSLQYVSNSGSAQLLGGLNSLAAITQGETASQQLADVKSQADLIAQQQRLVQCLADPKNCK
jgi:hypothetical protein